MPGFPLVTIDCLTVDVISDNVSDTYASKPAFAVSELANIMQAGRGLAGTGLKLISSTIAFVMTK